MHFATAGAAVMIADSVKNEYRDSTTRDLYDLARIADNCEHIHMFQRMCVLRDLDNTYEMDLNTTYCCVAGTRKHVGASWSNCNHLGKALEMLHIIAGGEAAWRARPFVSQSNCFVVPPMKFAQKRWSVSALRWKAACPYCCYQQDKLVRPPPQPSQVQ